MYRNIKKDINKSPAMDKWIECLNNVERIFKEPTDEIQIIPYLINEISLELGTGSSVGSFTKNFSNFKFQIIEAIGDGNALSALYLSENNSYINSYMENNSDKYINSYMENIKLFESFGLTSLASKLIGSCNEPSIELTEFRCKIANQLTEWSMDSSSITLENNRNYSNEPPIKYLVNEKSYYCLIKASLEHFAVANSNNSNKFDQSDYSYKSDAIVKSEKYAQRALHHAYQHFTTPGGAATLLDNLVNIQVCTSILDSIETCKIKKKSEIIKKSENKECLVSHVWRLSPHNEDSVHECKGKLCPFPRLRYLKINSIVTTRSLLLTMMNNNFGISMLIKHSEAIRKSGQAQRALCILHQATKHADADNILRVRWCMAECYWDIGDEYRATTIGRAVSRAAIAGISLYQKEPSSMIESWLSLRKVAKILSTVGWWMWKTNQISYDEAENKYLRPASKFTKPSDGGEYVLPLARLAAMMDSLVQQWVISQSSVEAMAQKGVQESMLESIKRLEQEQKLERDKQRQNSLKIEISRLMKSAREDQERHDKNVEQMTLWATNAVKLYGRCLSLSTVKQSVTMASRLLAICT
eukprot:GHVL01038772.1.p1 GENE.GHVL01038772.1~~GHVL01038772.1.p1  ORF type:complete len:586 (+),score=149.33 GHVL01038772.1:1511-3268(+)